MYATEVSVLAHIRPTGQIGFLVSHARDGNDEFVCKFRTSTSTCQENSRAGLSSLADDRIAWTSQVGWIGIEFGQVTEN